jgi:hypothetical protein
MCYNIQLGEPLTPAEADKLAWCAGGQGAGGSGGKPMGSARRGQGGAGQQREGAPATFAAPCCDVASPSPPPPPALPSSPPRLLRETFEPELLRPASVLAPSANNQVRRRRRRRRGRCCCRAALPRPCLALPRPLAPPAPARLEPHPNPSQPTPAPPLQGRRRGGPPQQLPDGVVHQRGVDLPERRPHQGGHARHVASGAGRVGGCRERRRRVCACRASGEPAGL